MTGAVARQGLKRLGRVSLRTKLLQGVGALPDTYKNFAFNTFLLFFYNQVLGYPATLASAALGIALCFDAVSDPMVGSYSDNLRSRLGRRRWHGPRRLVGRPRAAGRVPPAHTR